jgi:hypothetical protein
MGWARGSELYEKLIFVLGQCGVEYDIRKQIHLVMIDAFWEMDWDTDDECEGLDSAFDVAWKELISKS